MNNEEARFFIKKMMEGYKKRKKEGNLYSSDNFIPENIITTYYGFVDKPKFSYIIKEYKKEFIFNEARVETNISKEEQMGLGEIYDYIENFDFSKDYFNIFVTSLLLHQKLYSKCPDPSFGGNLRDTDPIMYDLNMEIPTASEAKRIFNSYISSSNDIFKPLENNDIFGYINNCVILVTDLIKLQPFADGNKRTFRALLSLLLKKIDIPPIYVEVTEREEYKECLIRGMKYNDYTSIIRFYYYKICDAIMTLDIEKSHIHESEKIFQKK